MLKNILIAAILLAAAAGGFLLQREPSQEPPVMAAAPAEKISFALPDLEGNLREFDEWEGKARLVNFWATWCAPCRREIPLLVETQANHGAGTLQVIGVAVDVAEDVAAYAEAVDFNYPVLIGQEDAIAAAETSGIDFIGLPVTMLVSADGDLIKVHMGEIHKEQIAQMVEVAKRLQQGDIDLVHAREALARF